MSNPDATSGLGNAMIGGLVVIVPTIMLFHYSIEQPILFHVIIIIGAFLISMVIHTFTQMSVCRETNGAKLFYGSCVTILTSLIALGVASVSIFRIPVASVVAPLFSTQVKSSKCCTGTQTLEDLEKNPRVKAMSYGFYMLFAMLFGVTYGTSIAASCQ